MHQQPGLLHGQAVVHSAGGLSQPFSNSSGQLLGASGTAFSVVAPGGIGGMTSLYGKLRTQAVPAAAVSAQAADAQLLAASGTPNNVPLAAAASSVGTAGYGWQGQKVAAASAISSDGSTILQPQLASGLAPLQYSLFSKSATTGSRTSSVSVRSTTSSVNAADQAAPGSFPATATQSIATLDAPASAAAAAGGAAAAYSNLRDALGLSSAGPDSAQDQQAMLCLLMSAQSSSMCAAPRAVSTGDPAGYGSSTGGSAQLLLTPPALSTAEDLSSSGLLQQLQQMYVNESAAAQTYQPHVQGVHALTCSAMGQHSAAANTSRTGTTIISDIDEARQRRVLMLRLQQLQESQARNSQAAGAGSCDMLAGLDTASAAAMPQAFFSEQYAGSSYSVSMGADQSVFSYQQMPAPLPSAPAGANPVTLQLSTQQQPNQLSLSQLLAQLGPGAVCSVSTVPASGMPAQHSQCAAGMGIPSTPAGPSSLGAAIEQFQQHLLMGSSGRSAAPLPGHGVFDSLAGLAAANAAASGASGLLPAGKHSLQVGPGSNPMYKVSLLPLAPSLGTAGCSHAALIACEAPARRGYGCRWLMGRPEACVSSWH